MNGGFLTKDWAADWGTAAPGMKKDFFGGGGGGADDGITFLFTGFLGGCTNGGMISPLPPGKNAVGSDGVSDAGPARFGGMGLCFTMRFIMKNETFLVFFDHFYQLKT